VLRPVFFMENFLGPWFGLAEGKLRFALAPDRTLQMIAVDDVGKYAARAFIRHVEMAGAEIDLAGDELTMPRAAELLTEVLGRRVVYEQQRLDDLRAGNPEYAIMVEWFDRVGYSANIGAIERAFNFQPTRFRDWATAHRRELGGA
jgi:uncharacterized protein YbjT (DUF2867 family)